MKKFALGFCFGVLFTGLFTFTSVANASQTLSLEDEYRDGDHKVCVYSDGRNTAVVEKDGGGSCPSKYIKRG